MILLAVVIFVFFGLVVFIGAPYVPTRTRAVEAVLDKLALKPGEIVVDLGAGDGVVLKTAAKRGLKAVGYEINPILCLVAAARCWAFRSQVQIKWRNFWTSSLPPKTKLVFIFLAGPFMNRLAKKLEKHPGSLIVASNGFKVPGWKHTHVVGAIYIYTLPNALQRGE